MKIETQAYTNFEVATIEKDTPVVSILLTADCFTDNTPHEVAVGMIYTDLLLSGAGEYSRDEFIYAINEIGANISISENEGKFTISVKTLAVNLKKTLKLLELMLVAPTFSVDESKRAIETTENALVLYKDDSRALAHDALCRAIYKKIDRHFSFTPEELISEIKLVSVTKIQSLHERFMNAYWTFSVGGNTKAIKESLNLIEKLKKSRLSIAPVLPESSQVELNERKLVFQSVNSKQNIDLSIGAPLPLTIEDADFPAFTFGLSVLGKWGGFAGRLMSIVREKEGLTYGIYAKTEGVTKTTTGYWRIMTFFAPKDTLKGVNSTLREIKKIHDDGITESECERFKNILKTGEVLVYDSLAGTVGFVHGAMLSGIGFVEYKKYRERLYTCTRKEVNQALKKYLDPNRLIISAAGPVEKVTKELKNIVKS
ncbi:MAG: Peptidase M16 inactive domain protein [Parcubacteria bacterium OLB19]|nr:MAG: Peptidase M16 inactive domain protein [Parcubacteria bacterium OLB19]